MKTPKKTDEKTADRTADLRKQAEARLSTQLERLQKLSARDTHHLVQELGTHQIELEMQNDELRKAQEEIEESRNRYADLYDFAPVGYLIFDKAGVIREINLTGATLLGMERRNLANKPFSSFVHKDDSDAFHRHCASVLKERTRQSIELRLTRRDGAEFFALLESIAVEDVGGNAVAVRAAVSDITDRKKTEEALKESELHYRSLFENMLEGYAYGRMLYDGSGRPADFVYLSVNSAFGRLTGLKDVVGRKATDVIPGIRESLPELLETYGRVAATGRTEKFEIEFKPLGTRLSIAVYSTERDHFTTVFDDITERTRTEEALHRAYDEMELRVRDRTADLAGLNQVVTAERQRLYDVLETLPVYVVLLSRDYHVPFANRFFRERFGTSLGRTCYDYLFKRSEPCENCETFKVFTTNAPHHWEWTGPDGRDYDIFDFPFTDTDGSQLILEMGIDVTERNQAVEALQEMNQTLEQRVTERTDSLHLSESRLAVYANATFEGILLSENGIILDCNDQFCRMCGRTVQELKGTAITDLLATEDRGPASANIRENRESITEHTMFRKDGTTIRVEAHGRPLTPGSSLRHTAIRDITERKAAEESLTTAHRELERRAFELEAVNRELEAFSYTVSHDLKAPLRSIDGFARALLEDYRDRLDATGRDYLARVNAATQRMNQLIDAMLNMARLTRGELHESTVNLSALVHVAAHTLRRQDPRRQADVIIAEKVKANGDAAMLEIVLQNLLDNAWKFTAKHASARIEFGVTDMDGRRVYFVQDDGAGFDMQFADKLFQPFIRMHAESQFPGLGIGLAIAHRIILRHGGRMWAEAAVGKGATFYFTLG